MICSDQSIRKLIEVLESKSVLLLDSVDRKDCGRLVVGSLDNSHELVLANRNRHVASSAQADTLLEVNRGIEIALYTGDPGELRL